MIYEISVRFFRLLGLVPIDQAAKQQDFENQLAMLFPAEEDREAFREGMLMFAKAGATWNDIEQALPLIAAGLSGGAR